MLGTATIVTYVRMRKKKKTIFNQKAIFNFAKIQNVICSN